MGAYSVPATGDPGLQPERTALAWSRTALALSVNALLALRAGLIAGEPLLVIVGVVLFGTAGGAIVVASVRRRQLSGDELTIAPPPGALTGITAATLLACVAGIVSVTATAGGGA